MFDDIPEELPQWLKQAPRSCPNPVQAARDLRPVIDAAAAEGASQGYVSDQVIRQITEAGIWGLRVPKAFGGAEVDARTYIEVIEELSYADGSTGWVVMAAGFAGGGGIGLGASAQKRIYDGNEGIVAAAQISKLGKAKRVDGGYRVSGEFQFGSGSRYSSWFGGAFAVEDDGKPVLKDDGTPLALYCITSRDKIRLHGNWDVFGLAATGSYDFEFVDQVIPDDWVVGLPGHPEVGGPTLKIGVSMGHVSWALGTGKRALDEIYSLAKQKRRFQRSTLIDQPVFQRQYGEHLTAMKAARELVFKVYDDWTAAAAAGPVGIEVKAQARLAACWATEVAHKAAQFAFFSAGSDGVRNRDGNNPLQRVFRDVQTGATHRHIDGNIALEATQVALGVADPKLEL